MADKTIQRGEDLLTIYKAALFDFPPFPGGFSQQPPVMRTMHPESARALR